MDESDVGKRPTNAPEAAVPSTVPEAQDPQDTTLFSPVKETNISPVEGGTTMIAGVSTMPVSTEAIADATLNAVKNSPTAEDLVQNPNFRAAIKGSQIKNAAENKRNTPDTK